MSSTPELHSAVAGNETDLLKLIDRLTRADLAERVAQLEDINSELRLRLDAIAQLSASGGAETDQGDQKIAG